MGGLESPLPFVDVHCHIVPGIDDGSRSWDDTLAMAKMAIDDGIETIIATPHQLGSYAHNDGEMIRRRVAELSDVLAQHRLPLKVLPGADVRIEFDMLARLHTGDVLTLGDLGRHVLLELPHELYFPLEPVLQELEKAGLTGVLSHPERNHGLMQRPQIIESLVDQGCLMQITAGSLLGTFGPRSREICHSMLEDNLVQLVATDAHGPKSRRPLLGRAYRQVAELVGVDVADAVCCHNPRAIAEGRVVEPVKGNTSSTRSGRWRLWRKAG